MFGSKSYKGPHGVFGRQFSGGHTYFFFVGLYWIKSDTI
jgi:hypothetical protein